MSSFLTRRTFLGATVLPTLAACASPLPLGRTPVSDEAALRRLHDSAGAHGLAAYRQLADINVSYTGEWRPLVGRVQPEIVDAGYRGSSQERLMPGAGIVAQAHTGPVGNKQVWRRRAGPAEARGSLGEVAVWLDGTRSADSARQQAAALVADCYAVFLLGPLWLADRSSSATRAGTERVDGRLCDVIEVELVPGLGLSARDRLAVCIDRDERLMRRVRVTLEGFPGTQGAVAEVDTFDHARRHGVVWPMRFYERVVHPLPLPAHDWRVTGLDVNRGYAAGALEGLSFTGAAAAPARAW